MIQGTVHPDFQEVARVFESQVRRAQRGGGAVAVYHRGEKVVDVWAGSRDAEGRPWRADTMALSFSTTKGVVATALHVLADRGLIDYDEPVAEYWPEFASAGKDRITVRQILCHEAGLYPIRSLIDGADAMLDWDGMCQALAEAAPAHPPGAANGYHAFTFGWLVGELVRRVSGMPVDAFVQREVAKPLGLAGLHIGAPPSERHRVAELLREPGLARLPDRFEPASRLLGRIGRWLRLPLEPGRILDALMPEGVLELLYSERVHEAPIPAANGVFTARSLARLYACLAAGGRIGDQELLRPETVARATEIQNRRVDLVVPFPMRWRLGYHLAGTSRGILPRGFGHFGYGGSGAFADPERDLAVAMVVNRTAGTPFGDLRMIRIGGAAVRCAERRGRR